MGDVLKSTTKYVLLDSDGGDSDEDGRGPRSSVYASFVSDDPLAEKKAAELEYDDGLKGELGGSSTVSGSIFNLSTTILGSGVLIMPFVCRTVGVIPFLLLLTLVAGAADYSIELLVKCVEMSRLKKLDYGAIGNHAYGQRGRYLALGSVILQQLGACILYIQIIVAIIDPADTFGSTNNKVLTSRPFWEIIVVVCFIFPLAMLKTMNALRYTSFLALFFIASFVLFVIGNGADVVATRGSKHTDPFSINAKIFSVLPSISFAFVCHMNVFPIYQELKNPTPAKMQVVSKVSMGVALTIYFFTGLFGYMTFFNCTAENLIDDFLVSGTSVSVIFDIVRGGYGIALVFSYPVLLFELRHSIDELLFGHAPWTRQRQFMVNLGILTVCTLCAIFIQSIATVFEFVGATSATLLVFIMPPLFYLKLQPYPFWSHQNLKPRSMMIFGLILMPTLLITATLSVFGVKSLQTEFNDYCGCIGCPCPADALTCPIQELNLTCVGTRGLNVETCI